MEAQCVMGIDLGGTQLRGVLVDREGTIYSRVRYATASTVGPTAVIDQIAQCVKQLQDDMPPDSRVLGVGVGAPGPVDPKEGVVFYTPNISNWHTVPLRDELVKRTGLRIEVGNDANAAALGEWLFGGGKGHSHMVYITISTGIGGGVISDNRLLLGHRGAAAEVGHILIDSMTSWENLASGTALGAAAARAMPAHPESLLHQYATADTVTSVHVALAYDKGDMLAQQLMEREAELIGVGLTNILHA
ncbi:MAG: ROK family protein, partial [Chloroflexaceae bacterium]|nr:ROK family protein [Chloroflexaceae bacterium]